MLSPKTALALIDRNEYEKKYMDEEGAFYPEISCENVVDKMNKCCIEFEHNFGLGKIVGVKSQLIEIGKSKGIIDS